MLAIDAGRWRFVSVRAHWTRRLPSVGQIGLMRTPWRRVVTDDRPRDARPSLMSPSPSFAGGSMFPPSLWRSRESLAGSGREVMGYSGTPSRHGLDGWLQNSFASPPRSCWEISPPLLCCSVFSSTHTFTPQHHHSSLLSYYIPSRRRHTTISHILIESSTMSFGKLYSYPVCTACDFTPPLLRGR